MCNVCSEWRSRSVRSGGTLFGGRRGGRLLESDPQGVHHVGGLIRSDGLVRRGPHRPPASAGAAVQTQTPLGRDNRRIIAGAPSHQVTEREFSGKQGEQEDARRAKHHHNSSGERNAAQPTSTRNTWL